MFAWALDEETGRWANNFGSQTEQDAPSIAVEGDGNPVLAGRLSGPVDFQGSVNTIGEDPASLFVVSIKDDATSGTPLGALDLGTVTGGELWVAADSDGTFIAGAFDGTLNGIQELIVSQGAGDALVARVHRASSRIVLDWLVTGGGLEDQLALAIALDPAHVVVGGTFAGELALGDGTLLSATALAPTQAFVAKIGR
jgi:hypothetical protein